MARAPFLVHVARLRREDGASWPEQLRGPIEDLACSGSAVPAGADCEADLVLESVIGGLSVQGTVSAPWVGECRRCLAPAAGTLQVAVRDLFTPGGDGEESYPLEGDDLDLEPLVRDAVLLELPQAPLCRPDCQGLCPDCGVDRNGDSCSCQAPPDPRWAALDALAVPDPAPATGEVAGN